MPQQPMSASPAWRDARAFEESSGYASRWPVHHAGEDEALVAAYRDAEAQETAALNRAIALAMAGAPQQEFEAAQQRHAQSRARTDEALRALREVPASTY